MGIFETARQRQLTGFGYNASKLVVLWQSKKISWHWLAINYGIRNSQVNQVFPVWNTSNNCQKSLMFGFGKLFFEVIWHR
jgi:hypothetical protein